MAKTMADWQRLIRNAYTGAAREVGAERRLYLLRSWARAARSGSGRFYNWRAGRCGGFRAPSRSVVSRGQDGVWYAEEFPLPVSSDTPRSSRRSAEGYYTDMHRDEVLMPRILVVRIPRSQRPRRQCRIVYVPAAEYAAGGHVLMWLNDMYEDNSDALRAAHNNCESLAEDAREEDFESMCESRIADAKWDIADARKKFHDARGQGRDAALAILDETRECIHENVEIIQRVRTDPYTYFHI